MRQHIRNPIPRLIQFEKNQNERADVSYFALRTGKLALNFFSVQLESAHTTDRAHSLTHRRTQRAHRAHTRYDTARRATRLKRKNQNRTHAAEVRTSFFFFFCLFSNWTKSKKRPKLRASEKRPNGCNFVVVAVMCFPPSQSALLIYFNFTNVFFSLSFRFYYLICFNFSFYALLVFIA